MDDAGGLEHADLEIVEGRVIVDIGRADDETVIGNDLDASVGGFLQRVRQRRAIDGRDHQDFIALSDHVLNLRELIGNIVIGVLQIGLVTLGLENLDHIIAVSDPPSRRLGRHGDADRALVLRVCDASGSQESERDRGGECLSVSYVFLPLETQGETWRREQPYHRLLELSKSGANQLSKGFLLKNIPNSISNVTLSFGVPRYPRRLVVFGRRAR